MSFLRGLVDAIGRTGQGIIGGTADAIYTRLNQREIEERNQRSRQADNALMRAAQLERQRGNLQRARGLMGLYGQGNIDLERDILQRKLTTQEEAKSGYKALANLATLGYSGATSAAGSVARVAPRLANAMRVSPTANIIGSGVVRGLENAIPQALVDAAVDRKVDPRAFLKNAAAGAAVNTAFSPRVLIKAAQEVSQARAGAQSIGGGISKVINDALDAPVNPSVIPNVRERSFTAGARTSPDVPNTAKFLPPDQYTVRSTQELQQRASAAVSNNLESVFSTLRRNGVSNDEELAQAIEAAKALDKAGRAEDASELILSASESLTKAGQFIQAASLMTRLSESGALAWGKRIAREAGKTLTEDQSSRISLLARRVENAKKDLAAVADIGKSPETVARFERSANIAVQKLADEIKSIKPSPVIDQIAAVWKAGLLTGLKTTGINLTANVSQNVLKKASDPVSSIFDAAIGAVTGERTKTATLAGITKGAKKGISEGWDYLLTGYDPRNVGSKLDEKGTEFAENILGRVARGYSEGVFRFIGSQDRPFYYAALYNSLEDQARAAAINARVPKQDVKAFIKDFVENPNTKAAQVAAKDAERAVFQQDTVLGKLARQVQNVPGLQFLVPFGKTPSAVITEAMNYTPVGAMAEVGKQIANKTLDQRSLAEALGKATTGTAIIWLGGELARAGYINGSYPSDANERAQWQAEGRKAHTIVIGDRQIDMQSLGNAGQALALGAAITQAADKQESVISAGLGSVGNQILEAPFLSGTSAAIDAIKDPERYAQSFANQMAGSVVPTFVADYAQYKDRDAVTGESRLVKPETAMEAIRSRIPGQRNTLPQEVDILGRPRTTGRSSFQIAADPGRSSNLRGDPVTDELKRLREAGETVSTSLPKKGDKLKDGTKLGAEGVRALTAEYGKNFRENAIAIIQSEEYQRLSDAEKSEVLGDIYSANKKSAKAAVNSAALTGVKSSSSGDKELIIKDGKLVEFDRAAYNERVAKAQYKFDADYFKDAGDIKGWLRVTDEEVKRLTAEIESLDSDTEMDTILSKKKELASLKETADKYRSYGGFKKGRKGGSSVKVRVAKAPKIAKAKVRSVSSKSAKVKAPLVKSPKISSGVGSTTKRRRRGQATRIKA